MDLERCIKLIKNAKTDNEMMAALMLVSTIIMNNKLCLGDQSLTTAWDLMDLTRLLQVAKLVNSSDIGADGRKKIFDAVGFSFINRLLATSMCSQVVTSFWHTGCCCQRRMKIPTVPHFADKPPEGCTENPYHKIAVTILACFCTDPDLVSSFLN